MKSLPKKPDIEFLKKQAKQLRALYRSGVDTCCDRLRQSDNSYTDKSNKNIHSTGFSINDAQRMLTGNMDIPVGQNSSILDRHSGPDP